MSETQQYAKPRHTPHCSIMGFDEINPGKPIDYDKHCIGYHCVWCGEGCSSHGCGCEWSERREVRPDDD